jgi:hypothetical protein
MDRLRQKASGGIVTLVLGVLLAALLLLLLLPSLAGSRIENSIRSRERKVAECQRYYGEAQTQVDSARIDRRIMIAATKVDLRSVTCLDLGKPDQPR